jgi:hypothetical protein
MLILASLPDCLRPHTDKVMLDKWRTTAVAEETKLLLFLLPSQVFSFEIVEKNTA